VAVAGTAGPGADGGTWDVLVVGGGPAGSAAALAVLRSRPALRVLVVDAGGLGRDKTCGDAVAAEAFDLAAGLGVQGLADGHPEVPRLRLVGPAGREVAHVPGRPARVVPRRVLDERLARAAQAAGAVVVHDRVRSAELVRAAGRVSDRAAGRAANQAPGRTPAAAIPPGPGPGAGAGAVRVVGRRGSWSAGVVIGADGVHSTVRRALGLHRNAPTRTGIALRAYAPDLFGEQLLIGVAEGWPSYAWSFPIGDGRANIGFGVRLDKLPPGEPGWLRRRLGELLPGPAAALEEDTVRTAHLPFVTGRVHQPDGPRLLAGDAAALVDPLTGEGIWYALESGRLAGLAAVTALDAGDPASAGALLRRSMRRRLGLHLALAGAAGAATGARPSLVDLAVYATTADSAAFDDLTRFSLAGGLPGPRLIGRLAVSAWSGRQRRP